MSVQPLASRPHTLTAQEPGGTDSEGLLESSRRFQAVDLAPPASRLDQVPRAHPHPGCQAASSSLWVSCETGRPLSPRSLLPSSSIPSSFKSCFTHRPGEPWENPSCCPHVHSPRISILQRFWVLRQDREPLYSAPGANVTMSLRSREPSPT